MGVKYTCGDYRQEMILLGLKRRLNDETLEPEEKQTLQKDIRRLEEQMRLD